MYIPKKVLGVDSLNDMIEEQLLNGLKNTPSDCWMYEKLYYQSSLKSSYSIKKIHYAQKTHQSFEQFLRKHSFDTLAIERYATFSIKKPCLKTGFLLKMLELVSCNFIHSRNQSIKIKRFW
jgi:hypothetical protein